MKVRDIIASALTLLGRAELASALSAGAVAEGDKDTVDTLLYCFNAVEDELARNYIPLVCREELSSNDKKYYFFVFTHQPVRIKKILCGGKEVEYGIYSDYIYVDAPTIDVEYEYVPNRKKIDGNSDFGDRVGMYVLALGMAEEYSYINGEAEAGDIWKARYRDRIDDIQRELPECAHIPPRRWV